MNATIEDLDAVRIFVHVAQLGSFSAAARKLAMPKSTVSRRVAGLERRLHARLLHRTTRKLGLTEVGAQYFARAERVMAELEEAERAVTELEATPRGTLRVTTPVDFGLSYLTQLMAEFQCRYRELSVVLYATNARVDLVAEGFDVALRAGNLPDSSLVARRVVEVERGLYASPEYLRRRGDPANVQELGAHDCIVFGTERTGELWRLRGPEGESEVAVSGRFASNDFNFVRAAAVAGLGIASLASFACAEDLRAGRLVQVLPEHSAPGGALYAVYPTPRHLTPKVRAFVDFVAERLAARLALA